MEVKTLLRAEDVLLMEHLGRWELVKGELITMNPAGGEHGRLAMSLGAALWNFARPRKLGEVFGAETGLFIERDPDTVRAADVMFVSNERLARMSDLTGFLTVAPDLAVEVVSPHDYWGAVEEKVAEYLAADVRLVCVVSPKTKSVHVYRPGNEVLRLSGDDELSGADVLPGFALKVSELFA